MTGPIWLFLTALAATIFCTAVNCYTYRLAYPLWRWVVAKNFGALHKEYLRRLAPVITAPHVVMFFASGLLLRWRPLFFTLHATIVLFILDAGVVLVSLLAAGPIHSRFERTGTLDDSGLNRLIAISAVRSLMMLAASAVMLYPLSRILH
jgi:hypothetical protein